MISDVLSDAAEQIREYLRDPAFSKTYSGPLQHQVERVVEEMDKLRANLDRFPTSGSPSPGGD
jgi:hypothetical protein